jgi:hypothetical protein
MMSRAAVRSPSPAKANMVPIEHMPGSPIPTASAIMSLMSNVAVRSRSPASNGLMPKDLVPGSLIQTAVATPSLNSNKPLRPHASARNHLMPKGSVRSPSPAIAVVMPNEHVLGSPFSNAVARPHVKTHWRDATAEPGHAGVDTQCISAGLSPFLKGERSWQID